MLTAPRGLNGSTAHLRPSSMGAEENFVTGSSSHDSVDRVLSGLQAQRRPRDHSFERSSENYDRNLVDKFMKKRGF